jgi:hypothetical protein
MKELPMLKPLSALAASTLILATLQAPAYAYYFSADHAVNVCERDTRSSVDSRFEAFVSSDGIHVTMRGTDEGRYRFKQCMSELGQDLR